MGLAYFQQKKEQLLRFVILIGSWSVGGSVDWLVDDPFQWPKSKGGYYCGSACNNCQICHRQYIKTETFQRFAGGINSRISTVIVNFRQKRNLDQ